MLDDFRNCPTCGNIYLHKSRNLCPKCLMDEEKDYEKVRRYVSMHPKENITDVAAATEVGEETILFFLKDGRLVSKGLAASSTLHCQLCDAIIISGIYCENCRNSLNQQFSAPKSPKFSTDNTNKKNSAKMYTQDKK